MDSWRLAPEEEVRCLECRTLYAPAETASDGCPACGCVSWITVRTGTDAARGWIEPQRREQRLRRVRPA